MSIFTKARGLAAKVLCLTLGLLLLARPAVAAIGVDSTGSVNGSGVNNLTYSQTLASGATLLVAETEINLGTAVTSIDYGGASPTGSVSNTSANGLYTYILYWWLSPPTGTNTLTVFYNTNPSISQLTSASYTGTATTTPQTQTSPASASVSTFNTTAITPASANSWLIGVIENSAATITAGTGTTYRSGAPNGGGLFDSSGTVTGSSSLQGTTASPQTWSAVILAVAPAGGSPPPASNHSLGLLGVGQ